MRNESATTILQRLIQFDTTNPPGDERPCIEYLDELLQGVSIETSIVAKEAGRPNLIARLPGAADTPALLFYGHVDVVTTAHQRWTAPPFEGRIEDGCIWGRGALDMKSGIAMMVAALLRAKASGVRPASDIVFAALSDEEAGGTMGARYLVEEHASLFRGVRYAIGEFGGFPLHVDGIPMYMIQVGEKTPCWAEVTIRGPGGHGARPMRDGAMAQLGNILRQFDRCRLPVHITPVVTRMIHAMADALPPQKRVIFRRLLNPRWTDRILRRLGETGNNLEPLFRNTVNATIVRGGEKPNVIPSEIMLGLDIRLLPGFDPQDLFAEIRSMTGLELEYEVLLYDVGASESDLGLFPLLADILREAHSKAHPVPYLLPGATDARFFSRLGIQTYGYTPMNLPPQFDFFNTIHAANERIPVESVEFGANALFELITRYGETG